MGRPFEGLLAEIAGGRSATSQPHVIHVKTLWRFGAGTYVQHVSLAGEPHLVVVPSPNRGVPYLIDAKQCMRSIPVELHAAVRARFSA